MPPLTIADRISQFVRTSESPVFTRHQDFSPFGSPTAVTRGVLALIREGQLVRIGHGVYVRAKSSVLSGKPIPERPLDELAALLLTKLGHDFGPSKATRDYNAGLTTQIPAGPVINTGVRRVTRRLQFGDQTVRFERDRRRGV